MVLTLSAPAPKPPPGRRYVRPPAPLHFPVEEKVPETFEHFRSRVLLFDSTDRELEGRAVVATDVFVYWDPTDPKKNLAPDLVVRLGPPGTLVTSWKTWERGAPQLGVEITSASDAPERQLEIKLERYRRAGIAEVVRFDANDRERLLRIWDLIDGDLVERVVETPEARFSDALGLYFCFREHEKLGLTLRLSRDPSGDDVLPTREEAERAAKEAALAAKDAALAAKDAALAGTETALREKEAALARIAELEAELAKRR
jgi:Uma2 family endonuclease